MQKGRKTAMKQSKIPLQKKLLIAGGIVGGCLVLLTAVFFLYVSQYYPAGETAKAILATGDNITVEDGYTLLTPQADWDTAIIFYPGAKVEAAAYIPILDKIRQEGVACILVEMPFRMAIFNANAAEDIMKDFPQVQHWILAGHSMGGAMASSFAASHPEQVEGLILMGAYIYGDYPAEKTLTVYGSLNQSVEDHLFYTENVVEIPGGNHAQFGDYGPQKGDPTAEITPEEQQQETVEAIAAFLPTLQDAA